MDRAVSSHGTDLQESQAAGQGGLASLRPILTSVHHSSRGTTVSVANALRREGGHWTSGFFAITRSYPAMTLDAAAPAPSIFGRVQEILFKPTQAWQRIAGEPTTTQQLFMGYAAPLAAIGPVCGLIGSQFFPLALFGVPIRTPLVGAVTTAVLSYVMALVGVYVLGRIIEALAPNFGAEKDQTAAMKVAVYSSTASWLSGVFSIFPLMAVLGLLGLYSLFLLFRGLPTVMKAPADKAMGYTLTVVVAAIVIFFLIAMVVGGIGAAITAGAVGAAGYGL